MDKVLLLNGSPHQFGCTHTALREVSDAIEDSGLQTEILHVGAVNIPGCKACGYCSRTGRCIMDGDPVNTVIEKLRDCSGLVEVLRYITADLPGRLCPFWNGYFTRAIPPT